jgi:DNA-binding PadR family transcriptional regulator
VAVLSHFAHSLYRSDIIIHVLDLAILGMLGDGPLHGYEIRRRLRAQLGLIANVSFGSLYPALARLEQAGDVVVVEGEELSTSLPATGSLSGERAAQRGKRLVGPRGRRSKKIYQLTEQGRTSFQGLLNQPSASDDQRSFGLRWSFARHLAPTARLALLERRRAQLVQGLSEGEAEGNLDDYAKSVVAHAAAGVQRDIAWLDELIAAERAGLSQVQGSSTSPTPGQPAVEPISPA